MPYKAGLTPLKTGVVDLIRASFLPVKIIFLNLQVKLLIINLFLVMTKVAEVGARKGVES
jgi:hypothetical protein